MNIQPFTLEKPVWTDADFDKMGWHDVHIHAIAFRPETFELWFDIDYIFAWVDPQKAKTHYSFWVAPATLVFSNVHTLKFDLESHDGDLSLQDIERSEPRDARNAEHLSKKTEWTWLLVCNE